MLIFTAIKALENVTLDAKISLTEVLYKEMLAFYDTVKYAAMHLNDANAKAVYNDLKRYFSSQGKHNGAKPAEEQVLHDA